MMVLHALIEGFDVIEACLEETVFINMGMVIIFMEKRGLVMKVAFDEG